MKREVHEWHEREDGVNRYYRANLTWKGWVFKTTLKTDPDWDFIEEPSRELIEEFREILFRKYQRARVSWKLIEGLDKMLEEMPPAESEPEPADEESEPADDEVSWEDEEEWEDESDPEEDAAKDRPR